MYVYYSNYYRVAHSILDGLFVILFFVFFTYSREMITTIEVPSKEKGMGENFQLFVEDRFAEAKGIEWCGQICSIY